MKVVIISDTHGGHEDLGTLQGDVLIHCGDFEHLFRRERHAIAAMEDWYGRQDFGHILCIGGNHDAALEDRIATTPQPFRNATLLNDSSVMVDDFKFYGAPWVPMLEHHAFYADDTALKLAWQAIPQDTDVLITHTPPAGTLDVSSKLLALGCPHLAQRVAKIKPLLHCFGHVHAAAGSVKKAGTTFVNASVVNSAFEVSNPPFECDLTDLCHTQTGLLGRAKTWFAK